ncbi:hypothetical protein KAR91_67755 [Candidatus Pacearchaeota archaeon]|nr:hypothetical protein [Candidatus Pacearchaeota archaeon]
MGETPRKSGKKNRKFGRGRKKPSHIRYTMEKRWERNKARRAKKIAKELAKKAARKARNSG